MKWGNNYLKNAVGYCAWASEHIEDESGQNTTSFREKTLMVLSLFSVIRVRDYFESFFGQCIPILKVYMCLNVGMIVSVMEVRTSVNGNLIKQDAVPAKWIIFITNLRWCLMTVLPVGILKH